mgnify:CR=1 FL=1
MSLQKQLEGDEKTTFQLKYENSKKSVGIYILLAVFLGWGGGHKFYLGKIGAGVLYLVFFWAIIPEIVAIFEAFMAGGTISAHNRDIAQKIYQEILMLRE